MKFTSFAVLKGPFPDYNDLNAYYDKHYLEVKELMNKSDLVKITLSDMTTKLITRVNFNLGLCDCCVDLTPNDIVKYEFFKKDH